MTLQDLLTRWRQRRTELAAARVFYTVLVYFEGPKTRWSGKVAEDEVIARHETVTAWLARARARQIYSGLDASRCGYVILHGNELVEQRPAQHVEETEFAL